MLVFITVQNLEVAINPLTISSIINVNEIAENGSPILDLHLINGRVYSVYYADFQALVRIVEEKIK